MRSTNEFQKEFKNQFSTSKIISTFLVIALISFTGYAQRASGFGFKGGLNYNANGNYFEAIGDNAQHPDRNVGYHFGIFGKLGNKVFFRPELVYTATKSDYNDDTFKMQKLDAPLLVGVKLIGPISLFGGPSLQYILDTEFDGIAINEVKNEFSVGLNFGIGLNLKKVGIDLRYERGFSDNEATFINTNVISTESRIDTRPDQLILSLAIIL